MNIITNLLDVVNEINLIKEKIEKNQEEEKLKLEKKGKLIKKMVSEVEKYLDKQSGVKLAIIYESLIELDNITNVDKNTLFEVFSSTLNLKILENELYCEVYLNTIKNKTKETIENELLKGNVDYFSFLFNFVLHPKDKIKYLLKDEEDKKQYKVLTEEEHEKFKTGLNELVELYIELSFEIYKNNISNTNQVIKKFPDEIKHLYKKVLNFMYNYDPKNFDVYQKIKIDELNMIIENEEEIEKEMIKISKWMNSSENNDQMATIELPIDKIKVLKNYCFYRIDDLNLLFKHLESKLIRRFENQKNVVYKDLNNIKNIKNLEEILKESQEIIKIKENLLKINKKVDLK